MNDCQPGTFCPDQPFDIALLVLIGAAALAFTLAAIALIALTAIITAAAKALRRRLTHTTAAAEDLEPVPPAHLAVIAAALDDWWLITDPHVEFNGADIAPRVEMYLLSSGYRVTPNP
ncbi:hypothetical protein AB0N31_10575 [Streptomyces sp. NPDC051051]|uniref:hypothetical protein n=1 Tax=Streptomyces sp. NPDC051051 TaxID=3155666 RepID=UPI003448D123